MKTPYMVRNFVEPMECKFEFHISINNRIFGIYYVPSFHTPDGEFVSSTVGAWLGWFEVGIA